MSVFVVSCCDILDSVGRPCRSSVGLVSVGIAKKILSSIFIKCTEQIVQVKVNVYCIHLTVAFAKYSLLTDEFLSKYMLNYFRAVTYIPNIFSHMSIDMVLPFCLPIYYCNKHMIQCGCHINGQIVMDKNAYLPLFIVTMYTVVLTPVMISRTTTTIEIISAFLLIMMDTFISSFGLIILLNH